VPNSFTFDGVDFADFGVTVTRFAQQAGADAKNTITPYAQKHGAFMSGRFLARRHEQWQCLVEAGTRAELLERIRLVSAALRPDLGERVLLPDHEPGIQYYARLNAPIVMEPRGPYACTFQLGWVMPDPFKYSRDSFFGDIDSAITIDATPFTKFFPEAYDEVLPGTAPITPVYRLFTGAPIAPGTITLEIKNTGESISWTGTLLSGETLVIRVDDDHMEKIDDTGVITSAMTGLSNASRPSALVLPPGERSEIEITGISDGLLYGEARPRWY